MRSVDLPLSLALAAQVRRLREQQRLTRAELATRAHLSRMSIYRIEAGVRDPPLSVLGRLALALGVEPGDLIRPTTSRRGRRTA